MDGGRRAALARRALAGYPHGPDAPQEATARGLARVERAEAVIIVEGVCDQVAVETVARRRGVDLDHEGIAVLPVGGAQAAAAHLEELGPQGEHLLLAGLYDTDATATFRRAVTRAGLGRPETEADLARLGFHRCHRDLEEELIRAVTPEVAVEVIESQGDLGSLRTFQKQPDWRGRPLPDQLRRFLGSKARRGQRYARLFMERVDVDRAPPPILGVLDHLV